MPEHFPTTDHLLLVDHYITALVLLAKEHCLDAVVEVLVMHYEDEDAYIFVYVPEGTDETSMDQLQAVLTQQSVQLLDDLGLPILVGVYEASDCRQHMGQAAMES